MATVKDWARGGEFLNQSQLAPGFKKISNDFHWGEKLSSDKKSKGSGTAPKTFFVTISDGKSKAPREIVVKATSAADAKKQIAAKFPDAKIMKVE